MFAKGIAHRVRTALVSAQGQLMLTLERLGILDPETKNEAFWRTRLKLLVDGADELTQNFQAVQAQLQNVTGTLDDYLHLTQRHTIAKVSVSLKDLVQGEMAEIYANRRPTLLVEFLSDDPLPEMEGDPMLLKFTIKTLMQNAMEALPMESGRVVIALKNRSDKNAIQLTVRDTGPGVPDHLRPRLFQPFFTTKENRQGLSLSRARRYAELHGGTLALQQTSADGTTFLLELPLLMKLSPPRGG
jgi:signal transduction histidine kinase